MSLFVSLLLSLLYFREYYSLLLSVIIFVRIVTFSVGIAVIIMDINVIYYYFYYYLLLLLLRIIHLYSVWYGVGMFKRL